MLMRKYRPDVRNRCRGRHFGGSALVETAVVLPVFSLFLFTLFEVAHAYMVVNILNAAATKAAREGVAEGVTTATVSAKVLSVLSAAFDVSNASVYVKNAGVFDTPGVDPTAIDYATLPDIELSNADPRQLFVVRVEIPYDTIAIFPPKWITGVTLKGQSVMRHE